MSIRPEPPDPLHARERWLPLHGEWDFDPDPRDRGLGERWFERRELGSSITVPFCVEAERSGAREHARVGRFWYLRRLERPEEWGGGRCWLRLGAVDHSVKVWLNGEPVGEGSGGFTPVELALPLVEGENILVLRVQETRKASLPRGKQTHLPFTHTIFYEPTSGIWQPVCLEERGRSFVERIAGLTSQDGRGFDFHVRVGGPPVGELELRLEHPDGRRDASAASRITGAEIELPVQPLRREPWSPEQPALYRVTAILRQGGVEVDRLVSYAGLRTVGVREGRVLLNGQPLYQRLVLYQPYWPGGWATAPSDEAMARDIELARAMGFNGLRIHQTIPDPRLLYHCDRLGMLVWEELPSPFLFAPVDRSAFEALLEAVVLRDRGHPSVISWVLFNETWGIFPILWSADWRRWVLDMVERCRALAPGALVVDNSGYEHLGGDLLDIHHYLADPEAVRALYRALEHPERMGFEAWRQLYMAMPSRIHKSPLAPGARYQGQPVLISECGGHGFGPYAGGELTLLESLERTIGLIREHPHLQGFCYTQLCDVAQERNGLLDAEREPKAPVEAILALVAAPV